jgi:long-chain acyl-CoA synthetase
MSIGTHARTAPDRPAIIDSASGTVLTYQELDQRSARFARYLASIGVKRGDTVALFMENNIRFMEIVWGTRRSGIYITAINRYLNAEEAGYIVNDSDAVVLVTSQERAAVAAALTDHVPMCRRLLMTDGVIDGWESYEAAVGACSAEPPATEWIGDLMLYSSGTTGRPKGIRRPLREVKVDEDDLVKAFIGGYGFDAETVYLSPAPMYHAAPLAFSLGVHHGGGTIVMMPRFDPESALAAIEQFKVTHSQWVPTMFVRMLKLPPELRARYDLSSHRMAIHAAAPCPVDVKQRMIAWWGQIIHEYYGGTEGNGMTRIGSADWLAHPGSVGRAAIGVLHICDENGNELPAEETGLIYFERDTMPFAYYKDPERTRSAQHPIHPNWSTLGDIGYVDTDSFLFLTDRRAFTIISAGVNIYPREIEDTLIGHPSVRDVAVFGIPDPEMGEQVKAVVEPMDGIQPSAALAAELIGYARTRLAHYKVPKSIDFMQELPRLPTGKLYKQALRAAYWPAKE